MQEAGGPLGFRGGARRDDLTRPRRHIHAVERRNVDREMLAMRHASFDPMSVEHDVRVGAGGDVFDDDIDRAHGRGLDRAGEDHHSFRQSRGEIVRERVQHERLQGRE